MRSEAAALAADAGDFAFDGDDFRRVCALIRARAGIALNDSKRNMVYSRLARRLRALGLGDFRSYLDALESGPADHGEWQEFVNALTTNLTSFFREAHHFPVLARLARELGRQRRLKVWCCAASTGEEPYSIAMTLIDAFDDGAPPAGVLATDIDTSVLAAARAGIYRLDALDMLEPAQKRRHFERGRNANAGFVRVRAGVRALLEWQPLNLMDARWPIAERFDAVFCRNVMIYFDKATQLGLLRKLRARLADDGLLFAGHSENLTHARELFEPLGHTVYRPVGGDAKGYR